MSNRTLIEINHDYAHQIEKDPEVFLKALGDYLRALRVPIVEGRTGHERKMLFPGVRVFGTRHHSEGFNIKWGCTEASEPSSPLA